jgi:hypothetical protein
MKFCEVKYGVDMLKIIIIIIGYIMNNFTTHITCWLSLPVDLLEEFGRKKTLARSQNQLNPVCSLMLKSKNPEKHNRIDYLHNQQGKPIRSNKSC